MHDYSRSLDVAVKKSRNELGLTQVKLAEMINVELRTIINIEGCEGKPIFSDLHSKNRPVGGFLSELQQRDAAFRQLQLVYH